MMNHASTVSEKSIDTNELVFDPAPAAHTAPSVNGPSVYIPENAHVLPGMSNNPGAAPGRPHTPFGIASLIIAIGIGFVSVWLFVGMSILGSLVPQPGEVVFTLLGLLIMGSIAIATIGLTLGMIGLFQRQCKKLTAFVGVSGNSFTIVGWILLILIGMVTG